MCSSSLLMSWPRIVPLILSTVSFCELWLIFFISDELAKNVLTPLGFSKQTKNGFSSNCFNVAKDTTQLENPESLE